MRQPPGRFAQTFPRNFSQLHAPGLLVYSTTCPAKDFPCLLFQTCYGENSFASEFPIPRLPVCFRSCGSLAVSQNHALPARLLSSAPACACSPAGNFALNSSFGFYSLSLGKSGSRKEAELAQTLRPGTPRKAEAFGKSPGTLHSLFGFRLTSGFRGRRGRRRAHHRRRDHHRRRARRRTHRAPLHRRAPSAGVLHSPRGFFRQDSARSAN